MHGGERCRTENINFVYIIYINEREEFMQETQHTQQTATRKAQNQNPLIPIKVLLSKILTKFKLIWGL